MKKTKEMMGVSTKALQLAIEALCDYTDERERSRIWEDRVNKLSKGNKELKKAIKEIIGVDFEDREYIAKIEEYTKLESKYYKIVDRAKDVNGIVGIICNFTPYEVVTKRVRNLSKAIGKMILGEN